MDGNPLSGRELEVLKMAASGMTNARITRTLTISPATVERHLANAYENPERR
jgi:DNA-binding CsgD family transcriptional regulator